MTNAPVPPLSDAAPTSPTVGPGPLHLGDLFGGTFRTYGRSFGLFVGLMVTPALVGLVVVLVAVAIIAALMVGMRVGATRSGAPIGALVGLGLVVAVAILIVSVVAYVFQGRTYLATLDLASGRAVPRWGSLAERTRGLFGRVVKLGLIVVAAVLVIYLVFGLVFAAVLIPTTTSGRGNLSPAVTLVMILFFVLFYAALIFVSVRLIYTLAAMAEEGLDAVPSLRRSWDLTKGAFWKTLGYSLVIGLIISIIAWVLAVLPAGAVAGLRPGQQPNGAQTAAMAGLGLVSFVGTLLLGPIQQIWTALMYLGRRREVEGAAATGPSFPPAPEGYSATPSDAYGAGAPAQQPYPGQPQQPYPGQAQQQHPGQPYPDQRYIQTPEGPSGSQG